MFNPTMGTGIAVLPVYVYRLKGTDESTHPSTSQGILFFNFSGSFMAGAKQTLYFNRNKYWLDVYAGYASMSFDHYMNDTRVKEEVKFKGFVSNISFAFKVGQHMFIGPIMSNNFVLEDLAGRLLAIGQNEDYMWFHVPGLKYTFDSRDNIFYPESGWFNSISYESLIHRKGNPYNFDKVLISASTYIPLSDKKDMILASHVFAQFGMGALPLHEMASPGAAPILRGYITGNYLNSSMVSLQSELRWMFTDFWGAVGFIGYGWLYDEPRDIGHNLSLPSIGVGARYRLFPAFKINLGLDIAFGRDDNVNIYFKLSESF